MIKRVIAAALGSSALLVGLSLPAHADTAGVGVAADVAAAGLVDVATSITAKVELPQLPQL